MPVTPRSQQRFFGMTPTSPEKLAASLTATSPAAPTQARMPKLPAAPTAPAVATKTTAIGQKRPTPPATSQAIAASKGVKPTMKVASPHLKDSEMVKPKIAPHYQAMGKVGKKLMPQPHAVQLKPARAKKASPAMSPVIPQAAAGPQQSLDPAVLQLIQQLLQKPKAPGLPRVAGGGAATSTDMGPTSQGAGNAQEMTVEQLAAP